MSKFAGKNIFDIYPKATFVEEDNKEKLFVSGNDVSITTDKNNNIIEVIDINSLNSNIIDLDEEVDNVEDY